MHFAYGQIGKNGLLVRNFELDLGLITDKMVKNGRYEDCLPKDSLSKHCIL